MQDENSQSTKNSEDQNGQDHSAEDIKIEPEENQTRKKVEQDVDEAQDVVLEKDDAPMDYDSEDESDPLATIKKLKEKLKLAVKEKQEYLDGWQRARADFTNARKREDETRKEIVTFANEDLIMQLMPVLDSFTMAFSNKEAWEKVDKNWRVGVEYIYSQLLGILDQNGFKEFDPKGEKFDPAKHVAVETLPVTDQKQDHIVLEVIQKGYTLNGKITRPARVKIGEFKT